MKSYLSRVALAMLCAGGMLASAQAALKSAKVSDYKGDVTVSQGGGAAKPVHVDSTVTPSDTVRTGAKSLAELQFNDNTLTRLGANTIFSYSPKDRQFQVESGTALLQVPPGLGGAKIETAAVTAAITGTTVMIQKLPSGVVKLMVLEGSMNATLKGSNQMRTIKAGQMLIIPPNINSLPQPIVINVATIMGTSKLVRGFKTELVSVGKIDETEKKQEELKGNGGLKSGGVVVTTAEDLINLIGNGILTSATFDALTQKLELGEQSDGHQSFNGPITVSTGSTLTPTVNNVLGKLVLASGQVVMAVAGSDPGDTLFTLQGPVTFTGQLPLISPSSSGTLAVLVQGTGLQPNDPAISFINSTANQQSGTFYQYLFEAAAGAINFSNADFNVTDTSFVASSGNINIASGSTLTVDQGGQVLFYAGKAMNIDNSGIEVIDSVPGANISLYSGGTMTVNNSSIGGPAVASGSVSLTSNGNMSLVNSVIGGSNFTSVYAYARANGNLSIMNTTIIGSSIVFGGNVVSIQGSSISGSSITIYTNSFQNLGGNTFSTTPSIQPYTP